MAPGLVFLTHILVLAFLSVTVCWGSACLAVASMWVTVCILTVLLCFQRPSVALPQNSHPPTCTLIATHIHSPKYLERSKAGPREHTACACLV